MMTSKFRSAALALLATTGLSAKNKKSLKTLVGDLDLIDWYNTERTSRPGPEPILDKKFK